jgi:hypothetical protein
MKIKFEMVFETDNDNVLNSLNELFDKVKPTLEELNIRNWMPTVTKLDDLEDTNNAN